MKSWQDGFVDSPQVLKRYWCGAVYEEHLKVEAFALFRMNCVNPSDVLSLLKICQSVIAPYELALLSWLPGLRPLLKGETLSSVNVVQLANKIAIVVGSVRLYMYVSHRAKKAVRVVWGGVSA